MTKNTTNQTKSSNATGNTWNAKKYQAQNINAQSKNKSSNKSTNSTGTSKSSQNAYDESEDRY